MARRIKAAAVEGWGESGQMPIDEWKVSLSTIGGELERADYHLARFESVLESVKARRKVAGGPVFGDPGPARAVYCEAAGYMSAVRTAIDIAVYVAARRAGATTTSAEKWEASKAVTGMTVPGSPPSKYDVDDIQALRAHRAWFETLNAYRNCMMHRGWHDKSFGYFDRGDTAPEAGKPAFNVMLVPDQSSLITGARPGNWTYGDRKWLDQLIDEVSTGLRQAVDALLLVWGLPEPLPGKIPLEDQPTVFLTVPFVAPIAGQSPPALHVFLSKQAARMFLEHFKKRNLALEGCTFRAIRRTTLHGEGVGYLIAYDAASLGSVAELHLMEVSNGSIGVVQTHRFNPSERNGPSDQILWFQLPTVDRDPLYVLAYTGA
ncbi:MAG: hypothetical protein WDO74_04525 [Pseudomonadota bacterium]